MLSLNHNAVFVTLFRASHLLTFIHGKSSPSGIYAGDGQAANKVDAATNVNSAYKYDASDQPDQPLDTGQNQ